MKEILKVKMRIDDYLSSSIWFWFDDEGNDTLELISSNFDEIEKRTKVNKVLLDALCGYTSIIEETVGAIKQDMTDLYKEIKALKESK